MTLAQKAAAEHRTDAVSANAAGAVHDLLTVDWPWPNSHDPVPILWHWLAFWPVARQVESWHSGCAQVMSLTSVTWLFSVEVTPP